MKKLMIAAAALVAGFAANAASFQWLASESSPIYGPDSEVIEEGGYYTYLMVESATAGGSMDTVARDDAITAMKGGDFSFADKSANDAMYGAMEVYAGTVMDTTGDVFTDNAASAINAYVVILDSATPGDATKGYATDLFTVNLDAYGSIVSGDGMLWVDFASSKVADNWFPQSSDIPEPTSGLLMLVGLAGLALRRRRA